ncbi:NADH dehydrogenase FAD-containing subunit [Halobacteriales archaeon QH_8_64_26]|nr:MAG: NADH dehydrogenase FAD-containing subunit [Halobacteriales archaeon QH_8_64_26]
MTVEIVVLGAGYGGAAAIDSLEGELGDNEDVSLTWISNEDYHFLLHESHRLIREASVREEITVPIEEIITEETNFVQGEVTDIDVDDRTIGLAADSSIEYDLLVVCLGSKTAFFGIDGLEEHALTLKSLEDAMAISERIRAAADDATEGEPAQVLVGGAGLTGIQTAGEIAAYRSEADAPIDVYLIERSETIFPGHDHEFQGAIRNKLEDHDVDIRTNTVISAVDDSTVELESGDEMDYDVLIWAGGITGQDALGLADLPKDHNRVYTGATLETDDDRVFALGDTALMDQDEQESPLSEEAIWEAIVDPDVGNQAPPTAEAAMEAGEVLGENVARKLRGEELIHWTYTDKGTLVSVGDEAIAHGVLGVPINTFSGPAARTLKKAISARWLAKISGPRRVLRAWSDM